MPLEPPLRDVIPEKFIRATGLLPLAAEGRRLTLAVTDPLDLEAVEALAYSTGYEIELRLATPAQFAKAWSTLYGAQREGVSLVDTDGRANEASEFDLQRLRDIANEAPVVRRVNQIVADAIEARASDIHIEPSLDGGAGPLPHRRRATHRRDAAAGIEGGHRLAHQDHGAARHRRAAAAAGRAHQARRSRRRHRLSRLDAADRAWREHRAAHSRPQPRRARFRQARLRAARRSRLLRKAMRNPNGIVLVTGPTGSGKTTTLYTALKELSNPDVKVFTVEDPIEYQLAGVNQVQVQPAIGLDFPNTLRAILRQDPDIIMIGEIRDAETARIAIQASLTGHLVFSTLHTNSAAASITRLIDMGVENYLIASTVKAVLAQRLVRRLCSHCATPLETRDQWRAQLAGEEFASEPERLSSPKGCPHCRNLGYSGRSTIAELLVMNDRLQRLVCENVPDAALEAAARESGMTTMYQCGMGKAWRGETSIEEVARVTRMD